MQVNHAIDEGPTVQAPNTSVYHCIICGPIMREHCFDGYITIHNNVPHPIDFTYDEEERPQ